MKRFGRKLGYAMLAVMCIGLLGAGMSNAAIIEGGSGSDCLDGSNSGDTIRGFGSYDALWGLGGDDTINGGSGDDGGGATCILPPGAGGGISPGSPIRLVGGDGDDTIYGLDGDDDLVGNSGVDELYGNENDDRIWASGDGTVSDIVRGGPGYDVCFVTPSDNVQGCEDIEFP
jgi:Ca2+-binding RTX toxin-like protein